MPRNGNAPGLPTYHGRTARREPIVSRAQLEALCLALAISLAIVAGAYLTLLAEVCG